MTKYYKETIQGPLKLQENKKRQTKCSCNAGSCLWQRTRALYSPFHHCWKPLQTFSIRDTSVISLWKDILFKILRNQKSLLCWAQLKCGFMKGKSYLTNLIAIYDEGSRLEDEERALHVYLEFGKTFDDASNHLALSPLKIIIGKVRKYGLHK